MSNMDPEQEDKSRLERRLLRSSSVEATARVMRLRSTYQKSSRQTTFPVSQYRLKAVHEVMAAIRSQIRTLQKSSGFDKFGDSDVEFIHDNNVELKRRVMQHAKTLIGVSDPQARMPTAEDLENFRIHQSGGPSTDNFRCDFSGHVNSEWNNAASGIFVRSFLQCFPSTTMEQLVDVEYYFKQFIMRVGGTRDGCVNNEIAVNRSDLRRLKSFYTRLHQSQKCDAIIRDRITRRLLELGPEGMSSDESDNEAPVPCFYIKRLPWRSRILTESLRILDKEFISENSEIEPDLCVGKDEIIHRLENACFVSKKAAVGGMSVDSYDAEWLQSLPVLDRLALNCQDG